MTHAPHPTGRPVPTGRVRTVVTVAVACLLPAWVAAQGVYRIVGPDGRVTFSDQPPASAQGRPAATAPSSAPGTGGSGGGNAALPFELRRVATQFPVTLYTGKDCAPCNSGRNLLSSRGIPFVERTVTTPEDAAALTRMAGESSLPVLTVGSQQIKGYSDVQWGQYLDAAGYPKQSQLPPTYRRPAPEPMVAVQPAVAPGNRTAPATSAAAESPGSANRPADIPVQPPAGFRF